jgi:hypothetical protein
MIHYSLHMQQIAIFLLASISGFLLSSFVSFIYNSSPEKVERLTTKKGYHIHHSMYGLTSFMAAPIMISNHHPLTTLILIGLGLGIITEHTIRCGFNFITKED